MEAARQTGIARATLLQNQAKAITFDIFPGWEPGARIEKMNTHAGNGISPHRLEAESGRWDRQGARRVCNEIWPQAQCLSEFPTWRESIKNDVR